MNETTYQSFAGSLQNIPWFSNLGQPNERDNSVDRIAAWEDWSGPEKGYVDWLGRYSTIVREFLISEHPDDAVEIQSLANQIENTTVNIARNFVADFSDDEDSWHGPTACVWQAAYLAGTIGCYLSKSVAIPVNLQIEWYWFRSGHWPCDYADEPDGYDDESLIYTQPCRYVVL